ncbi:MAG: hypothetical protein NTV06_09385 [candidate division Zixibacteria bacterium]|nr:hypothetical protein [candidate division Zixibacteria bacterium]
MLLNSRWGEAKAIFMELHRRDTTDPAGYLFRAAILQAEMIDKEANLYGTEFLTLLDNTKLFAKLKLSNCNRSDSALCFLYIGHQYAYRSLWEARFGSNWSALNYGLKAKGEYHKALAVDTTLYDIYLGLGSYHYWKTARAGLLRTAGIFRDDREKGIREIKLAADSSLFSRETAHAALIWVFINEKQFDSAITLSGAMNRLYPEGNSFLWPLGEAYFKSGQYIRAAEIYDTLWRRIRKDPGNYYNLIESGYWLCISYGKIGGKIEVRQKTAYFDSIYQDIPKEIRRRQRSKLGELNRISK